MAPDENTSQEQLSLLRGALEESLETLAELAAEVGLSREQLIEDGESDAASICEPLSASWHAVLSAREVEHQQRLTRKEDDSRPGYLLRLLAEALPVILAVFSALLAVFVAVPALRSSLSSARSWVIVVTILGAAGLLTVGNVLQRRFAPDSRAARERREAAELGYEKELLQTVQAWLRQRINAAKERSYSITLDYRGDCKGLAEVDDPNHEIPTQARARLAYLMQRMPGGAIGISGPRGVGKSTLMRSVCEPTEGEDPILATVVDAPVDYDGRDFILHLFAKVCSTLLGEEAVAQLRSRDRSLLGSFGGRRLSSFQRVLAGPLVVVVGFWLPGHSLLLMSNGLGLALIALGFAMTTVLLGEELSRLRRRRSPLGSARPSGDPADVNTATEMLQRIWFQQSFSAGWSGSLKIPIGVEGGVDASSELVEQPMTFPDVVDLFKKFLKQVSGSRRVRIGIDELDKMSDEDARRFLNEIKVGFRVPGCFFLISISEDAMSFFERRGLPIRDVFDSSLDEVMQIPQLELEGSEALLDRRIVDLPLPFVCLLHCISGGLPRDLIRAARDLVELEKGTSLEEATAKLVGSALASKASASQIAARRFESESHITLLNAWLEGLRTAGVDPEALLEACRSFERDFLAAVGALAEDEDLRAERRELQRLGTQMVAFAYLAATMLEFFPRFDDRAYLDEALQVDTARGVLSRVDRLADVTQAFSADVNTPWEMLSRLRLELGMKPVAFPSTVQPSPTVELNGSRSSSRIGLLRSVSQGLLGRVAWD